MRVQASLVALAAGAAAPVDAQPLTVHDRPQCSSCRIVRHTIRVIGRNAQEAELSPEGLIGALPLPDGGFVGLAAGSGPPIHFPAAGGPRLVGRRGRGPGEFISPAAIVPWDGDSLLVYDQTGRWTILSPGAEFVRQAPGEVVNAQSLVATGRGTLIANRRGGFFEVLDRDGKVVRIIGQRPAAARMFPADQGPRFLATDGATLWTVPFIGRYQIEAWDLATGALRRRLERRASFYPPYERGVMPTPEVAPSPGAQGLFFDGEVLWVLIGVADRTWRRGLASRPVRAEGGVMVYPITDIGKAVDTVVEAWDPETGRLLASARFGEHLNALLPHGRLAIHLAEGPDGAMVSHLVRFELRR